MNQLSESSSLYLRQHASNPVDWKLWTSSALAEARAARRPILLSIGYSACHWCHVMAHECFEDPEIAAVMNDLFVNIKVDREERPDLDKLYQLAHQLLTGRGGGWPLTVFLDPESLSPFFAGTYFPPSPRHGLPGFAELIQRLRAWFDSSHDDVRRLNQQLGESLAAIQQGGRGEGEPEAAVFERATEQLRKRRDQVNGGFIGAPKFPQAPLLEALPALARTTGDQGAADQLLKTLRQMSIGGLRDQLDGGFFRYTVDADWTIPHFEKMLYDNAQLLPLYAEAANRLDDAWLGEVAAGIVDWMSDSLGLPGGGFASSMDADAGGVEGGFHVWDREQVRAALDEEQCDVATHAFGLDLPPNFEGAHWHLTRRRQAADPSVLDSAITCLLEHRAQREPPATDDKLLTAWNALAVTGLARAGRAMQRDDWLDAACACLDFVREHLWIDGCLYAVHANGRASQPAFLDDHAFLLRSCLDLLKARWRTVDLDFARQLADLLLDSFLDSENGGFFFTARDRESPVTRLRVLQDDATPAGNGIAGMALQELGHLLADQRYLDAVAGLLAGSGGELQQSPLGHASLLLVLDHRLAPPAQVIITGPDHSEVIAWKRLADSVDGVHCYAPTPGGEPPPGVVGATDNRGQTVATVCKGLRCLPPFLSLGTLEQELKSGN
jgi:uncharacterized protein YyaL (SSP411 family)